MGGIIDYGRDRIGRRGIDPRLAASIAALAHADVAAQARRRPEREPPMQPSTVPDDASRQFTKNRDLRFVRRVGPVAA